MQHENRVGRSLNRAVLGVTMAVALASCGGSGGGGGGDDGGCSITRSSTSGLPEPCTSGIPKPSGTSGNLRVLDWAGFKSAVTYTFDDTQPSQAEHYAELQGMGVRLTFYANDSANWQSGYDAFWSQAVRDGHEIGNHTEHHCRADLTGCSPNTVPDASLGEEIDKNSEYIRTHLGASGPWTMASPFGDAGWVDPARTRVLLNRGVFSGTIAPNDNTDPFNLPVYAAVGNEAESVFDGKIDSARSDGAWLIFLLHSIKPTANNWYAGVDISTITGSATHAKAFGDVWIDSLVEVGAYWRAQKLLSSLTPTASGGTQTWTWTLPAHFPPGRYVRVTVDGGSLSQGSTVLPWDAHGYYEVSLDAGTLTLTP